MPAMSPVPGVAAEVAVTREAAVIILEAAAEVEEEADLDQPVKKEM